MGNNITRFLLLSLLVLTAGNASAQLLFNRADDITVTAGSDTFHSAWAGGLNSPQFSAAELNNDGIPDLVIFNRGSYDGPSGYNGNKILTFINNGTAGKVDYVYAPEYQQYFPKFEHWLLMVDFNCDGIEDVVTSSSQSGMVLYRRTFGPNNEVVLAAPDTFQYFCNTASQLSIIPALYSDIPCFADVNNDGDIDVLGFDNFTNAYVSFFENRSMELTGTCNDTLVFHQQEYCWGHFSESPVGRGITFNTTCPFANCNPVLSGMPGTPQAPVGQPRHAGSTLMVYDRDGDGDKDVIIGDLSSLNMVELINGGNKDTAIMIPPADTLFPVYNVPVHLNVFPAAFNLDVNNDGKKDILVAPNAPGASENWACSWYYKNISLTDTVVLELQTDTFLIDEMIDLGEGAYPAIVELSGDTLLDLIVGNTGYFLGSSSKKSGLAYFKNVGTALKPAFQLMDRNYAGVGNMQVNGLPIGSVAPTFGDLDGDGDIDMIVGDDTGRLQYFTNNAGAGQPASFTLTTPTYAGIDIGNNSVPFLFDVNGDGVLDMIIGRKAGNIYYFENRGTATNPVFDPTPTNNFFGLIDNRYGGAVSGYTTPVITRLDSTNQLYLVTGSDNGTISVYEFNRDSIAQGSGFTKLFDSYGDIDEGERVALAIGAFTNSGKLEMITGNYRGGLTFYTQSDTFATPDNDTLILAIGDTIIIWNGSNSTILTANDTVTAATGDTIVINGANGDLIVEITNGPVSLNVNDTLVVSANGTVYLHGIEIGHVVSLPAVGIAGVHTVPAFIIFPNPAENSIQIKLVTTTAANAQLEILDMLGRTLVAMDMPGDSQNMQVDVSHLSAGMYFCKVKIGNAITAQKLMIK